MSLDFVALDFETANSHRGSPCAVGLTVVDNGSITSTHTMLMRPPEVVDYFDGYNIAVHGITPDMVAGSPQFADIWPNIHDVITGKPVIAHYAAFDMGVLREACTYSELPWPDLDYGCTVVWARQTYDLVSYSLPYVADAAGVDLGTHHDAGSDAQVCAQILLDIAARHNVTDIDALLKATLTRLGRIRADDWRGAGAHGKPLLQGDVNPDADPGHYLYGQNVVFTGGLGTLTRQQAFDAIAQFGATGQPGIRKDTTLVVVGDTDPYGLRPDQPLTGKLRKAQQLQAKGQTIEIITGFDFLNLLYSD